MSETSVKLFLASCMGNSSGDETGHSLSGEHSRALLRFRLTFAAMLRTPQIVVICLVLLLGISSRVHAQASPSPIYYLIEHVDVRSHDSLRGFEIGTQVELVQDFGDRLRVKSGNFEFEVDRKLLTNDSGIASQVWENYQAALENYRVQQEQLADQAAAALAEQQQQQAEEKQQQQEAAQQQAQQQPQVEIPWALQAVQAVQAIQTEQERQEALEQQAEQQREAEIAQAQALYRQRALQRNYDEELEQRRTKLRGTEGHIINAKALGLPHEEIERLKEESRRTKQEIQNIKAAGIPGS